jgi:large subunit ribosomal protein L15
MKLSDLRPAFGSRKKTKLRGRGEGSGHGKTSCRGAKGQRARSGHHIPAFFEGGQMPLIRRIPKRGFNMRRRREFQVVNLKDFSRLESASIINPQLLKQHSLINDENKPIKILGEGELKKALTVVAHSFSQSARDKIQKANGKIEIISLKPLAKAKKIPAKA